MGTAPQLTPEMRKAAELWRERQEAMLTEIQARYGVDRKKAIAVFSEEQAAERFIKRAEGYSDDISVLIKKRRAAMRRARYRAAKAKRIADDA